MRWLLTIVLLGCGGGGNNDCDTNQVQVTYFRGAEDGTTQCKPLPAACGAVGSCSVQACEAAMYSLCDTGYIGVGRSDTFAPTIISCNP